MQYTTVFEIGFKTFPWSGVLHPVLFILVGMFLLRFGKSKQIYQAAGIIVAILATIICLLAAVSLVPNFIELRRGFRSGNSSIVEGVVEDFHPAPP
jgi:hypothetical protein